MQARLGKIVSLMLVLAAALASADQMEIAKRAGTQMLPGAGNEDKTGSNTYRPSGDGYSQPKGTYGMPGSTNNSPGTDYPNGASGNTNNAPPGRVQAGTAPQPAGGTADGTYNGDGTYNPPDPLSGNSGGPVSNTAPYYQNSWQQGQGGPNNQMGGQAEGSAQYQDQQAQQQAQGLAQSAAGKAVPGQFGDPAWAAQLDAQQAPYRTKNMLDTESNNIASVSKGMARQASVVTDRTDKRYASGALCPFAQQMAVMTGKFLSTASSGQASLPQLQPVQQAISQALNLLASNHVPCAEVSQLESLMDQVNQITLQKGGPLVAIAKGATTTVPHPPPAKSMTPPANSEAVVPMVGSPIAALATTMATSATSLDNEPGVVAPPSSTAPAADALEVPGPTESAVASTQPVGNNGDDLRAVYKSMGLPTDFPTQFPGYTASIPDTIMSILVTMTAPPPGWSQPPVPSDMKSMDGGFSDVPTVDTPAQPTASALPKAAQVGVNRADVSSHPPEAPQKDNGRIFSGVTTETLIHPMLATAQSVLTSHDPGLDATLTQVVYASKPLSTVFVTADPPSKATEVAEVAEGFAAPSWVSQADEPLTSLFIPFPDEREADIDQDFEIV